LSRRQNPIVEDRLLYSCKGHSQEIINKEALKNAKAEKALKQGEKTGKALKENNIEQRKVLKSRESEAKRATIGEMQ
jgi:hypothetical protein